jgi:alpha-tubulin suppressor-like RCC1 family protein
LFAAATSPGCRQPNAEGFPASVDHHCPSGYVLVSDRCYRRPPGSGAPPGADDAGVAPDGRAPTVSTIDGSIAPTSGGDASGGDGRAGVGAPAPLPDAAVDAAVRADSARPCPTGDCELRARKLALGATYSCALLTDGSVRCWGENVCGLLGAETPAFSALPLGIPGLGGAVDVAIGGRAACAVLANGSVRCWGCNDGGVFGTPAPDRSSIPIVVPEISGATAVAVAAAGSSPYACALVSGGAVLCWTTDLDSFVFCRVETQAMPRFPIDGVAKATAISGDSSHMCTIVSGGSVRCWGCNSHGELGMGPDDFLPRVVDPGLTGVTALSAGRDHTCAVRAGAVWCWGEVPASVPDAPRVPNAIAGLGAATSVAANIEHTCAVVSGKVRCWGFNSFGQLGDGTTLTTATPVEVGDLRDVRAVFAGPDRTCAILTSDRVRCWGRNHRGQLGSGAPSESPVTTPVPVLAM